MKRILIVCCEKIWHIDAEWPPAGNDTIELKGIDKATAGRTVSIFVTVTHRLIDPYKKIQQLRIIAAPAFHGKMTCEYIKENITPKDAIHDT